ncbi:hypothetical protein INR49_028311 [Caranx melampygus]|nr:hypothetical protein INR49_028311 [Caranx melampygus]
MTSSDATSTREPLEEEDTVQTQTLVVISIVQWNQFSFARLLISLLIVKLVKNTFHGRQFLSLPCIELAGTVGGTWNRDTLYDYDLTETNLGSMFLRRLDLRSVLTRNDDAAGRLVASFCRSPTGRKGENVLLDSKHKSDHHTGETAYPISTPLLGLPLIKLGLGLGIYLDQQLLITKEQLVQKSEGSQLVVGPLLSSVSLTLMVLDSFFGAIAFCATATVVGTRTCNNKTQDTPTERTH